jgi:solute carrier family 39 (zinc transporter), member 1/2/3
MFGIGVIAATGWCHLIPDAFAAFSSECLADGWAEYGPAFVGVFALLASFIVQLVELCAGGGGDRHSHGHMMDPSNPSSLSNVVVPPNQSNDSKNDSKLASPPDEPKMVDSRPSLRGDPPLQLSSVQHEKGRNLSTIILEAGILFHSIIIGLSLGVTGDFQTFKTLLMAICFHQFFEGLALGALISKLDQGILCKYLVMGLMYPLTTPIGMAIGILIRQKYNSNAESAILTEGIFNSLS